MEQLLGYSDYKPALMFYDLARGIARIENDDPGVEFSRVVWPGGMNEEIGPLTEADFYQALTLLGARLPITYPVAIPAGRPYPVPGPTARRLGLRVSHAMRARPRWR